MWTGIQDFFNSLPTYARDLLIAGGSVLVSLAINWAISKWIRSYCSGTQRFSIFRSAVTHLRKPMYWLLPLISLNLVLPMMHVKGSGLNILEKVSAIILIVVFATFLIAIVRVVQDYVFHVYDLHKENNLRERKIRTQLQFIRKFIIYLIVILAACAILLSFDGLRRIGASLLTGVGIGGIIVGFAAQKSLGNLLAGLQIAFTQPIRIDDVLVVEGEWGRVEEISLTYVVLNIWDKRRLILPITYFIEKPFQNWTRTTSEILGTIFLYLDYSAPVDDLRKYFEKVVRESDLWDGKVAVMQVTDVTDRTLQIRGLVSSSTSGRAFDLRCMLREKMMQYITENHAYCLPRSRTSFETEGRTIQDGIVPGTQLESKFKTGNKIDNLNPVHV